MKKVLVMVFCIIVVLFAVAPAFATYYEYVYDSQNLFDDSADMLNMAKEIRNKLDFDVHIYSVSSITEADKIIDENKQNASALLFFIDRNQNISWWSGSGVKKIIRDVDFEILISGIKLSPNQYTEPINFILSNILNSFVYVQEHTPLPRTTATPAVEVQSDDPVDNIFNSIIKYIRDHPVPIFLLLVALIAYVLYHRYHTDE